jgi:microcystin degradation protein MlrC
MQLTNLITFCLFTKRRAALLQTRAVQLQDGPLLVECVVERLYTATFTITAGHIAGKDVNLGPSACLRITSHNGQPTNVAVVVTSHSGAHFAAETFEGAGLDPWNAAVLVAKSPAGYRATYGPRAGLMLTVDYPGCSPPRFWLPEFASAYSNIRRPLYPWDDILTFDPTVSIFPSAVSARDV